MKQKKLGNILYVMSQTPYQITKDLDVSVIYVDTNLYDEFVKLNQSLDLTRYNYLLLRKSDPEYLPYVDAKEQEDFNFPESVFNVSSFVDETKTMTLQPLSVPENYDGVITYYLDGVEIDGSTFVLENAGAYVVSAITSDSSIYEDDLDSSYVINYNKEKRTAVLSFANSSVNITVEDETSYSGNVQAVSGIPTGQTVNYYLGNTLLSNGTISINDLQEGLNSYTITAKLEDSSIYNNTQASYTLNITMEISDYETKYLTIEPLEAGNFSYTKQTGQEPNLSYSFDGSTWTELEPSTNLALVTGQDVKLKSTRSSWGGSATTVHGWGKLNYTGNYNVFGNVMSLLYGDNYQNKTSLTEYYVDLSMLFQNQTKLISAENFVLPATTLCIYCYNQMFDGCTSLTTAPKILPTNSLSKNCYTKMFCNCTSLTTAPILPATTMQSQCYSQMFKNCSTLEIAPQLPGTTLSGQCYEYIFEGCTSLTTAPELPARNVVNNCYIGMFLNNSHKLNYIKMLANSNFNNQYMRDWVKDVSTNGTFVISKGANVNFGTSGIPYNWVIINNETNKEVYPLKFNKTSFNVSTYTTDVDKNYSGTVLDVSCNRTIPNGLVKYYLNNTLMSGNTFELTESGTYTIKAKIDATDSIDDSEATYNIVFAKNIKKNATINVTFSSASNKLCTLNEQVNVPTISYTTNPASPEPLVNVSYSFDGQNYVSQVQSQYLDTTQYGRFTYYVKLEIPSTDQNYNAQTKIVTWNWKVGDSDLSHYTCLTDIDETLLDTSAVEFQEIIFDHSGNYTNASAVSITLRNMTTNECIWSKNRIQTKTNGGEIRDNGSSDQNITAVGTVLQDHPGYYHYMFSSPMRIYVIDANAVKSIVYFKIPQAEA